MRNAALTAGIESSLSRSDFDVVATIRHRGGVVTSVMQDPRMYAHTLVEYRGDDHCFRYLSDGITVATEVTDGGEWIICSGAGRDQILSLMSALELI